MSDQWLDNLMLVGGVPSSGSTLLSALLDGHPNIVCGPELSVFSHPVLWRSSEGGAALAGFLTDGEQGSGLIQWSRPDEKSLSYYGSSLESVVSAARTNLPELIVHEIYSKTGDMNPDEMVFAEKSPQNLYAVDSFLSNRRSARAILTLRSPSGVINSLIRRGIDSRIAVAVWTFDASLIANLMRKYSKGNQIHLVRYEDLVTKPKSVLADVCRFMGVDVEVDSMIEGRYSERMYRDLSLNPKGGGVAGTWRSDPRQSIRILDDDAELEESVREGLVSAIVPRGAGNEFVDGFQAVTHAGLCRRFHYERTTSNRAAGQIGTGVFESDRVLSRYEQFFLRRVSFQPICDTQRAVMQGRATRSASWLVRKSMSASIRLFRRSSIIGQKIARLGAAGILNAHELPRRALGAGSRVARALTSRGQGIRRRSAGILQRVARYAEIKTPAVTDRMIATRSAVIATIDQRAREIDGGSEAGVSPYARVPLPAEKFDAIVAIAFQGRNEILSLVVKELLETEADDCKIGVVLACSNDADINFAQAMRSEFESVGIVTTDNLPLGLKWQRAVDCARQANPRYLVITGSDDIISARFVRRHVELMDNRLLGRIDMAGPRTWYMVDLRAGSEQAPTSVWRLSYSGAHHQMPLGAGRVYPHEFLAEVDWQIFDTKLNRLLDDQGYNLVIAQHGTVYPTTLDDGVLISAKGGWAAMNSVEAILNAESVVATKVEGRELENIQHELGQTWLDLVSLAESQSAA